MNTEGDLMHKHLGLSSISCLPESKEDMCEASDTWPSCEDKFMLNPTNQISNINITFRDINYHVTSWTFEQQNKFPLNRGRKKILKGISGDFRAYELTGIIGPSGSGKSSLLDILSGYSLNFSGEVLHNGCARDLQRFRRQAVYIMQDCVMQPLLTVREAMMVSAQLKLGNQFSSRHKMTVVSEILETLELTHKSSSLTVNLSGGEMKRLAIALECVNNPPVMFFDEPTTGLDYHMAKKCLLHLKQLASRGHSVICTLHQPSAAMFEQLDHVLVMAEGRCVYQGRTTGPTGLTGFLAELGLACPQYHNPADHVLDVSVGEYGDCMEKLVDKIKNGKCNDWRSTALHADSLTGSKAEGFEQRKGSRSERLYQPASFVSQFLVLVLRSFLKIHRDRDLTYLRFGIHCAVGSLLSLFYAGIGSDAAYVLDNFRLLFFSIMFLMFTALSSMIISFPLEMPIIIREHFNQWYSLKSYYFALTVADTPIQVLCTLAYCSIVYTVSRQPLELFRFGLFLLMCTTVTLFTQAVGVLVGTVLSVTNGVIFGPLTVLPWLIFSGFFLLLSDAPVYLQWLFHISFLKYALEGLMLAVYGYDREKMPCSDDYCHFRLPKKFLKQMEMSEASYSFSLVVILSLYITVKVVTYFLLNYRLRHKRLGCFLGGIAL